jgi:amino-acid N-acetyltransferase
MQNIISITAAEPKYREAIIDLLQSENLPVEDLPGNLTNFFIAKNNSVVIGAIGLEIYGDDGLLRSLVVKSAYRKMKIATALINELERLGRDLGLKNMYLLTETAREYFEGKGYQVMERSNAPALFQQSSEFTHACPASATLMRKNI